MARKFRSVKRVARGLFGPSKKTLQRVYNGITKQADALFEKELPSQKILDEISSLNTPQKRLEAHEKLNKKIGVLKAEVAEKYSRKKLRIVVKYSLDVMNITGEKRKRIFRIMEEGLENKLIRGSQKVAPVVMQRIQDRLIEELGSKIKARLFVKIIRAKTSKWSRSVESFLNKR